MNMNENFRYLNIGLPEDILRRKQYGDLAGAIRLIDRRMAQDIPDALRRCMLVERELMLRLPQDYPYTREAALRRIREHVPDFTGAEFDEYVDSGRIDWIYLDGEPHYFLRFYQTLVKVYADFAHRAGEDKGRVDGADERGYLAEAQAAMEKNGSFGRRIRIRASVRVNDGAFEPGRPLTVHIPIPCECRQQRNIVIHATSHEPYFVAPADAPQRTACFKEALTENAEFFVEYSYDSVIRYTDPWNLSAGEIQPSFDTGELMPHICFTPYMRELAASLTAGLVDPIRKAEAIYDFITLNVNYSFMRDYFGLENIAENCARNFKGDCGVQALLFITLCRIAGIPARWQSGLCAAPDGAGAHDWAEFFVAPYGWMYADPSFGGGGHRIDSEARRRFYFGNIDPYRMVANTEFQAELAPAKKFWRHDPYDNQTGEIETDERGLLGGEYERDQQVISITEVE